MAAFKVLHVVGGSEFGGIAPYIASLVKMAIENGGEAHVLVTAPRVVEYFSQRGIKVVQLTGIDRPFNPFQDMQGLIRLFKFLRQNDYSIVHTHTSKGGIIGRLAAYSSSVPVIIHTSQGYAFQDYATSWAERWIFLQIEKLATRWCDLIIAANSADRQLALDTGIAPEGKIVTVENCIDLEAIDTAPFSTEIYHSLGLNPDKKIVGVMARLSPQKGIEFFIEAMPTVLQDYPTVQFLIVGEGQLLAELKALVDSKELTSVVNFVGFRSDWVEVLRVIDVFVMPSIWEGLPITLLGAMASARPIVATRIKGITDVCGVEDVAILVEPSDSKALAQAINILLGDEVRALAFGRSARRRVEEEYSEKVMNSRIWQLYSEILTKKSINNGDVID